MLRRTFLKGSCATILGTLSDNALSKNILTKKTSSIIQPKPIIDWSNGIIPVYCLAYIDPLYNPHKNQESFIAKYPIAVIPQDSRPRYQPFKDTLRELNPNQKIIAYQMTLDENGLRGPGHELLRNVKNSWLTLPGGIVPTINIKSGNILKRRIYDPRNPIFRLHFIEACKKLIHEHSFDGIFFDNCTIYSQFAKIPILGTELLQGLQQLIQEVRTALPNAILLGNSRYNFAGLNGEMNEGRPKELPKESTIFQGHSTPNIDMYHYYMKSSSDLINAEQNFMWALQNKCFYGTGVNAQTIKWYDFIDRILSEYEIV